MTFSELEEENSNTSEEQEERSRNIEEESGNDEGKGGCAVPEDKIFDGDKTADDEGIEKLWFILEQGATLNWRELQNMFNPMHPFGHFDN